MNQNIQLKQAIKQQFKKCAISPIYFLKNYAKIQHPIKGLVPFNLYKFQEETLQQFLENEWNIILKSRQMGISTLVAGYILWMLNFNSNKSVLVIANTQDVAMNLIRKIKTMYDGLPSWLKEQIVINNKQSLQFKNNSMVKAAAATPNAGVSQALSLLVFDQAAVLNQSLASQIWTSAQPTLATGGKCIVLSTPRGCGNTFHRLWTQAEQGINRFHTIKLPWYLHPERDQAWRDAQTKELGQKQASRECDCQFATSGDTVISNEILEKLDKQSIMDPLQKMHRDELWIWRFAQNEENYILSADVARGDGSDFSAFQILSIQKNEQVAEYKGKISTVEFGQLIVRIAKMYNNALVVVENASIGWAVLQEIINQGYKNLYYHKKDYKYIDPELHSRIRQSKNFDKQKDIVGFTTSSRTRPLIIERMITIIQNNEFVIHSKRLLNQFWTFIWLNGKQQAMSGYNDDLVMALAIGIWVRNTAYIINKEARAFAKTRLASINSGLNLKYKEQSQISSGFFNSNNAFEQLQQNKIEIGSQLIDLNEFYFSKGKEDK